MTGYKCKSPIVFIIFNREDTASEVFKIIKQVQPPELFVIADGARQNKTGEQERVEKTRAIINGVDWVCRVYKNFSETNLGCRRRISSGLDWVFSITDRAIILEDDCCANISFFKFCDELLEKYASNEEIMMISGNNNSLTECTESFYFTNYFHIWGWATWRRAWIKNEINMESWPENKKNGLLKNIFNKRSEIYYWEHYFDLLYSNNVDSWAVPWTYSCYKNHGISIAPKCNLISNIGIGGDSTHTKKESIFSKAETGELSFPLVYPKEIKVNKLLDEKERKLRNKDSGRLPYPIQMVLGKIKWFIINFKKGEKT